MQKFQYTAVNKQGKTLSGVISAEDQNEARIKLNSLKLSVISIVEIAIEDNGNRIDFTKFKFEGADKDGKKVIGTIASKTILEAFKKLTSEYQLKIFKIASTSSSKQEFDESVQKVSELEKLQNSLEDTIQNDNSGSEVINKIKNQEYLKLIEEVILTIRKVKNEFAEELKPDALEFLAKYENHLEKIKHSENLDNVIDAALKVLKRLEEADLFLTENKLTDQKLKLQLSVIDLSKSLREKSNEADSLRQKLNAGLKKFGITKKEPNIKLSNDSKILDYLKIIFTSKSNSLRITALKNIFPEMKKALTSNNNKQNHPKEYFSKTENELLKLSYYLCFAYLTYYFAASFLTSKIINTNISKLLFIFNTKLLIYIVILMVLFHSGLKLRKLMIEHKIVHSKIIYSLLSILFAIIIINL